MSSRREQEEQAGILGDSHYGADFIVPPGYPNDGALLRVESGERVQVTPTNEMRGGGGGGGETNVIVMLDGREIAAHVETLTGRNFRAARNAGAALTGR